MRRTPVLAALIAGCLLAGCSLLRGPAPAPHAPPAPAAKPPPPPELPRPVAMHRFTLSAADGDLVGAVQKTIVGPDDTLSDIARRFDVGYEEMALANPGVDPWLPGVGREVVVPTMFVLPVAPREGVVVNIAAMRIFYFPPHKRGEAQRVYTHPIGIGKVGWKTPEGTTRITARQKDPVWIPPQSVREEHAGNGETLPERVPAGPNNPLGAYMFRLDWPSYLIHGTNKPYGVGMRSSHGCMRLYPEDIAVFFDLVPVGTKVTVVNQPYLFGWRDHALYLQAYAVLEDDTRDWNAHRRRLLDRLLQSKSRAPAAREVHADDAAIDWQRIRSLARNPRAVPVPVSTGTDGIDAILASARRVANTLPAGSNWDGKGGLLIDEKTYHELLGERSADAGVRH